MEDIQGGKRPASNHQALNYLSWLERTLLLVGVVALGWCAAVLLQAHVYQAHEKEYLESVLRSKGTATFIRPKANGDFIGQIDVPRLGISAAILEGIDQKSLRLGVGHVPGTPLPGEFGNISLAAHRDTFFRPLKNIKQSDEIHLTTFNGPSRYIVDWVKIVSPSDTQVLRSKNQHELTLITCYPFFMVGNAPKRYVVRAHRVSD